MNITEFFHKNIEPITKSIALFFVVAYGFGFMSWNAYLGQFGFFEYNFLQTRFLSSGVLTIFALSCPVIIFYYSFIYIKKINYIGEILKKDFIQIIFILIYFLLFIYSFYFFVLNIFPRIPQYLGGARPFAKSIIANEQEIKFLSDLNMSSTPNGVGRPSVQTIWLCEIYGNNDTTIIGTSVGGNVRVIIFKKELFNGFQVVPLFEENFIRQYQCNAFIGGYIF